MGCNAYNHPPWCECGFQGGNCNQLPDYFLGLPEQYFWVSKKERLLSPNARCPSCGSQVYYYQNEHGSKVYFDTIGSPWMLHPCFERGQSKSVSRKGKRGRGKKGDAFDCTINTIQRSKSYPNIFIIYGSYGKQRLKLFSKAEQSLTFLKKVLPSVRLRKLYNSTYVISSRNGSEILRGYTSIDRCTPQKESVSKNKERKRKWLQWDGKLKQQYSTAMADAMKKAIEQQKV